MTKTTTKRATATVNSYGHIWRLRLSTTKFPNTLALDGLCGGDWIKLATLRVVGVGLVEGVGHLSGPIAKAAVELAYQIGAIEHVGY